METEQDLDPITALIVPRPRHVDPRPGQLGWRDGLPALLDPSSRSDAFALSVLARACEERGLDLGPAAGSGVDARLIVGQRHRLVELHEAMAGNEPPYQGVDGYWIDISPDRILLMGESAAGVYYGIQTLIALLPDTEEGSLPCGTISDSPALSVRGLMPDLGRRQVPTLHTFKRMVERMAALKMNALLLYFEDAYHFPSHPEIGAGRDRVEPEEMVELVAFARDHHVRVIPILQGLGHMEDILGLPMYDHLRENDVDHTLNPLDLEGQRLLEDLIGDICAVFPDELFHAGFDEVMRLGTGRAAEAGRELGPGALFAGQVRRVQEILQRHDRRMVIWADQLEPDLWQIVNLRSTGEDALEEVPRDVILSGWHYGNKADYPNGELFQRLGFEQLFQGAVAHFNELSTSLPDTEENSLTFMGVAKRLGVMGGVASLWEDVYHNVPFDMAWPGIAHFAESMWSDEPRPMRPVLNAWLRLVFGAEDAALGDAYERVGRLSRAIPWGGAIFTPPVRAQFFAGPGQRRLEPDELKSIDELGDGLLEAEAALESARARVPRNPELLDLQAFAQFQARVLVKMIRQRHHAAGAEPAPLDEIINDLREVVRRYRELWQSVNRPLNLAGSVRRYEALLDTYTAVAN